MAWFKNGKKHGLCYNFVANDTRPFSIQHFREGELHGIQIDIKYRKPKEK